MQQSSRNDADDEKYYHYNSIIDSDKTRMTPLLSPCISILASPVFTSVCFVFSRCSDTDSRLEVLHNRIIGESEFFSASKAYTAMPLNKRRYRLQIAICKPELLSACQGGINGHRFVDQDWYHPLHVDCNAHSGAFHEVSFFSASASSLSVSFQSSAAISISCAALVGTLIWLSCKYTPAKPKPLLHRLQPL